MLVPQKEVVLLPLLVGFYDITPVTSFSNGENVTSITCTEAAISSGTSSTNVQSSGVVIILYWKVFSTIRFWLERKTV